MIFCISGMFVFPGSDRRSSAYCRAPVSPEIRTPRSSFSASRVAGQGKYSERCLLRDDSLTQRADRPGSRIPMHGSPDLLYILHERSHPYVRRKAPESICPARCCRCRRCIDDPRGILLPKLTASFAAASGRQRNVISAALMSFFLSSGSFLFVSSISRSSMSSLDASLSHKSGVLWFLLFRQCIPLAS